MLFTTSSIAKLASILSVAAIAVAAPHPLAPPTPSTTKCPINNGKGKTVQGKPWQIGASAQGGNGLGFGESHSVGYTFTEGADQGIKVDDVIQLGLSFSVAESVTDTISETVNANCPKGPWTCSLMVFPSMLEVSGHVVTKTGVGCSGHQLPGQGKPWTVHIPRTDPAGNGVYNPKVCACKNKLGWADKGAPSLVCMTDC